MGNAKGNRDGKWGTETNNSNNECGRHKKQRNKADNRTKANKMKIDIATVQETHRMRNGAWGEAKYRFYTKSESKNEIETWNKPPRRGKPRGNWRGSDSSNGRTGREQNRNKKSRRKNNGNTTKRKYTWREDNNSTHIRTAHVLQYGRKREDYWSKVGGHCKQ